ncbi:fimbrial protein [Parabacteroides massiliensis]|uniref:fimbrial protein n=1 Tax=Parabacteroides massiliensis TaxID=1750560 RepID=UPI00096AB28B|nr:fimbrial protein [Parabacteroides massiliensis]
MKLKSCFLITLIACAFFSCSDNDDPVNLTITPVVPDATLSLAVRTDGIKTKGGFIGNDVTGTEVTWDKKVKTLTAVIFNNGAYNGNNMKVGSIAALFTQNYADPTSKTVIDGEVKSGGINLLLIANLDAEVLKTLTNSVNSTNADSRLTLEQVVALATPLSSETEGNGLTMSSAVLPLELVPGINFVGFGAKGALTVEGYGSGTEVYGDKAVELIRTVAAINLKGVLLPETPDAGNPEYKNVSFTLDSVFVANVKSTAGIGTYGEVKTIEQSPMADGALDPTYYRAPENFASYVGTYKTGEAKGDNSMLRVLDPVQTIEARTGTNANTAALDWENTSALVPPCYVYPNQNGETGVEGKRNYTLLVLRGTYRYKIGDNEEMTEKDRYYTVIVNDLSQGGTITGDEGKTDVRIQRNTKYNVAVQILGSGSDDPFSPAAFAHVAAQVRVADWNVIEIDEEVD